mmetsp:Transcript_15622/g.33210  ORF Transcript_15622/g.33210 Transcript_15622/m.33210 type:complete len:227 (+) Transcript_15622:1030-1710(+)
MPSAPQGRPCRHPWAEAPWAHHGAFPVPCFVPAPLAKPHRLQPMLLLCGHWWRALPCAQRSALAVPWRRTLWKATRVLRTAAPSRMASRPEPRSGHHHPLEQRYVARRHVAQRLAASSGRRFALAGPGRRTPSSSAPWDRHGAAPFAAPLQKAPPQAASRAQNRGQQLQQPQHVPSRYGGSSLRSVYPGRGRRKLSPRVRMVHLGVPSQARRRRRQSGRLCRQRNC